MVNRKYLTKRKKRVISKEAVENSSGHFKRHFRVSNIIQINTIGSHLANEAKICIV